MHKTKEAKVPTSYSSLVDGLSLPFFYPSLHLPLKNVKLLCTWTDKLQLCVQVEREVREEEMETEGG